MLMLFAGRPLRRALRWSRFLLGLLILVPALLADFSTDLLVAYVDSAARLEYPIRIASMAAWTALWLMCVLASLDYLSTFREMAHAGVRDHKVVLDTILAAIDSQNGTIDKAAVLSSLKMPVGSNTPSTIVVNTSIVVDNTIMSATWGLAKSVVVASSCVAVIAGRCIGIMVAYPVCCAIFMSAITARNLLV